MDNKMLLETVNMALDLKIVKLEKYVARRQYIIQDAEANLKGHENKVHMGGGLFATIVTYKEDEEKRKAEAIEQRDLKLKRLEEYKAAKVEIEKRFKAIDEISEILRNTAEGSDAPVLDESINECIDILDQAGINELAAPVSH